MKLNKEQQLAVDTIEGPVLLLAGAGAGKTRVITQRIAHMINDLDINSNEILAITFTKKAANEMKERIEKISKQKIEISTFHSFGLKLIKEHEEILGYPNGVQVIAGYDVFNIINDIKKQEHLEFEESTSQIANMISGWKMGIIKKLPKKTKVKFELLLSKYQDILKYNDALDFSDLILKSLELLKNEEILEKIQERYKYIMVDEYQDTDNVQFEIINLIAQKYQNICVVGDENQGIYGFRGANIQNIINFKKDFPKAKQIVLGTNYRSSDTIVEASNAVIKHNKNKIEKIIKANRKDKKKIFYKECLDVEDEARYIVDEIEKNIKNKDKENAILYRFNYQSRALENELRGRGLAYTIKNSVSFYDKKEIQRIIRILYAISNPSNKTILKQAINVPIKRVKEDFIDFLFAESETHNEQILETLEQCGYYNVSQSTKDYILRFVKNLKEITKMFEENADFDAIIDKISEIFGFNDYIMKRVQNVEDALKNIEELKNIAYKITQDKENKLETFLNYIEKNEIATQDRNIQLMTIHSSKGLEFDNVFITGFEQNLIPSEKDKEEEDIEEERRLFYVGLTRAKNKVYLTRKVQDYKKDITIDVNPSMFLKEIPEKYIEKHIFEREEIEDELF